MEVTDNRIKKIQSIKAVGSCQKNVQNTKRNRVLRKKLGFFALNFNMGVTVTTVLLLLVGLTSVFPLTAIAAAPTASGAILRVVLTSDATNSYATPVAVSRYFSDADGDTLSYTAVSGDTGVATVSVSGSKVTITRVAAGRTTVAVTASDPGGSTATQIIDVRVHPFNSFPMNVGTISSIMLPAGGDAATIDTLSYITRPDEVALTIMQTGDKSIITSSLLGAKVTITPKAKGATRVRFGNAYNDHTINVKVLPANRAPAAQGTISPVTLYLGGSAQTVDFSSKLSDPDDNPLVYSAVSSAPGVATVSLSGTVVKITQVKVGTSTVTVTARDGKLSGTQTIAVTVPNRAPVAVGTISPVTATLGGGAIDVDVSSKFSDPDLHTLSYTTVSSDTTKATASVSGSTVKITAVAVGTVTVTVTANDGNGGTGTQTIGVTVPNRAPTAVGTISPVTLTAGGSATDVDVSSKFGDPDNHTLTYTAVSSDTSKATVSVSGAVVKITPRASGTATVTVTANDNNGGSVKQTISVRVSNRAPIKVGTISPVTLTAAGSSTNVDVSGKFLDPDSDTLSYTAVSSDTTKATVSVSSSTVTITPVAAGSATVTVTASDGSLTATQTISVTVEQSNRAPTAVGTISPVTLTTAGSSANVNVSSKFSDPNGDTLNYTAVSSDTTKATVSVSSAVVTITPKAVGTSTVTVTASDGSLTATQTIAITVRQSNRAPTAVGTISPVTLTAGGISTNRNVSSKFSDPDNDTLGYTAVSSNTTKATVSVSGAVVTITPKTAGTATVTVTASDGSLTATQTISVTVNPPPNGAPTTVGTILPITLTAGGSATNVGVSTYFSDPDGDTLTYTAVSSDTTKATVSVSSSTVTITPKAVGGATVTVTARDSDKQTATQTIGVTVSTAPNSAPERVGTISPITLTAGGIAGTVNVSSKFSDPDNDTLTYTAISSNTAKATVSVSSAVVTITPKAEGATTVTVTARDNNGLTATQTIAVLVTAAPNRAPIAVGTIPPVTLTAGTSAANVDVSSKFRDPNGDTLSYTAVSSDNSKATANVLGTIVAITPVAAGSATVTVTARDNNGLTATQTIVVLVSSAPNRAPVAVGAIPPVTLTTGASAINVDLSSNFSDPDSDPLTYTAVSSDTTKATVDVSGNIVVISPVGEGTATVTATARDNNGLTAQQTIAVLVAQGTGTVPGEVLGQVPGQVPGQVQEATSQPNRAPVAVGTVSPIALTAGDSAQTVNLSIYFSDPDGDLLNYTVVSSDTSKALVNVSGAIITITPVAEGTTTITVMAQDPEGLTATQVIVASVSSAPNRAPVAVGVISPFTLTAGENPTNVDLSTYFSDPDGDTLSYTAVSANTRVTTVSVLNSTITISPVGAGGTVIMLIVQDTSGLTVTRNLAVTVNPAPNRAPVTIGTVAPIKLIAGENPTNVDISTYFSDLDGDRLSYTAVSADTRVATISVSSANITITPVDEGATTVTVTVSDGSLIATQAIPVLVVPAPNRAPVVTRAVDPLTLTAGASPTDVDVSIYFSDPDGDPLSYTAVSEDIDVATVSVSSANITITPVDEGATTITVIASDASLNITQAIPILVVQPNRVPVVLETIAPITLTAGDNAITLDVADKFLDPAGDVLTYSAQSADTGVATVEVASSTIIITPVAEGGTTVIVTAQDSEGLTALQTVAITVTSTPNRAPVPVGMISPITLTAGANSTTVGMADKFFDPDGDTLTYTALSSNAAVVTVTVSSATLTINPVTEGTATVMLIVKDTHGLTVTRNFTVMVNSAPNRAPVVARTVDPIILTAGKSAAAIDVADLFSDPDGDPLTYTAVSANTAVVTVNMANSTLTISPVAEGSTTVILTASDGSLNTTQTIAVTVNPALNRAPIAVGTINPITLTTGGSSTTMNMADKFSDPDGDRLAYNAVSANAAVVTVNVINSTLTINPVAEGATTVMVIVQDIDGLTVTRNVTVTVLSAPNRAPVAVGIIDPITLILEDADQTIDLSTYFSDPDGDVLTYTAASSNAIKATVSVSYATLTISPVAEGTTTVIVIVQDTDGLTVTQNIAVTVNPPPNRAPVAGTVEPIILVLGYDDQTVDLSSRFSDPDDDDLTYSAQSADTNVVTVAVEGSTLKLTPIVEGTTMAIITVQDTGGLTITENITVVVNEAPNIPPSFTSATAFSVIENITTVGTVAAMDTDDEDSITEYTVTGGADRMKFGIDPLLGELRFNTAPDFENPEDTSGANQYTVVVQAVSGTGDRALTADQTITVTVTDGNDAPLAIGTIDPVTLTVGDEDQTVDVSDKFSDPDDDVLTYSAQSADTTVAQVTVEGAIVTITPVEAGTTTVTVTALDPGSLTATQPIAITVDVVGGLVNAAGRLTRLDATISAVLDSTGLMKVNPGWTVANGDALMLTVDVGIEGLEVTADISELDSTQSFVSLTPDRNGVYTARISISENNTALNGVKHILVTATDAAGDFTQLIITSTLNNRYVTELLPNYPNPFNPETWIPYRLGKDAEVTLTIYDARGDVVRRFDLGYQPAGAYETRSRAVYWNGTNDFGETVANGVYFYSLSTNDYNHTRKATILK